MLPGFCGALWWFFADVPVHRKDFAFETALKMADSLISAQTTELWSGLRCTLSPQSVIDTLWRPRPFPLFHTSDVWTVLEKRADAAPLLSVTPRVF